MYVCLCHGVTNHTVAKAVAAGATTSSQVAIIDAVTTDPGYLRPD